MFIALAGIMVFQNFCSLWIVWAWRCIVETWSGTFGCAWWCWQNADKTCASWRRELFACRNLFSPFCQVLDIWEKGLGWTIQPRDSGLLLVFHHWVSLVSKECYNRHQQAVNKKSDSLPRGAASDASDAWFSWELGKYRRSRRWCILGWRQVSER